MQIIDFRLALLIGLAAFMVAVGFDSSGNPAEAADLMTQSSLVPVSIVPYPSSASFEAEFFASDAQLATGHRLRPSSLTSASLTHSQITRAHLFTGLPSD